MTTETLMIDGTPVEVIDGMPVELTQPQRRTWDEGPKGRTTVRKQVRKARQEWIKEHEDITSPLALDYESYLPQTGQESKLDHPLGGNFSDRTTYHGKRVNKGLWYVLKASEKMLSDPNFGGENDWIYLYQGSWSGASASAGTHAGSGAFDCTPYNWKKRIWVFRLLGMAAWYRPARRGVWVAHIHAIMCGDGNAAASARRQVSSFWSRPQRNGLAGNARDYQDPQMVSRPLFVFPEKTTGKPGKRYCKVACHAYKQSSTRAPHHGGQINVGDVLEVVAVTRDRDSGKLWSLTKSGRCIYEDNFSRAA